MRMQREETATAEARTFLYLFVGIDDAAENTDVIFTVGYDTAANTISVVQIPRDTFFRFGTYQNKINQFYASARLKGSDRRGALASLAAALSSLLGVRFDGWLGFGLSTFGKTVDAIGGIDVTLDAPRTLFLGEEKWTLPAGEHHLIGKEAEAFVRSRKGYLHGDLDRLEAQKLFLSALFDEVRGGLSIADCARVARVLWGEAVTDLSISDALSLFLSYKSRIEEAKTDFCTLPGKPCLSPAHISYYVITRDPAAQTVKDKMFAGGTFDPDRLLTTEEYPAFSEIYEED